MVQRCYELVSNSHPFTTPPKRNMNWHTGHDNQYVNIKITGSLDHNKQITHIDHIPKYFGTDFKYTNSTYYPLIFKFLFILRERERDKTWVEERQREKERENPKQDHVQHGAHCGTPSHNSRIMTWAKIKSGTLNWLSHPGTPTNYLFLKNQLKRPKCASTGC